jgi:hypothetical protein
MFCKPILFRLAAILLGTILGIFIGEILTRIFYQEPWYENLGKTQKHSEEYQYTKNNDGLRDVDYPVMKYSDHHRILILGDSYTFGLGVPNDEDTFPEILETKLNEEIIHKDIKKIEVLNGGIPGSFPHRWLRLYKSIGAKFNPDIVLIVFFLRDGCSLKVVKDFFKQILNDISIKNRYSSLYQDCFIYRLLKDLQDRSEISAKYTNNLKRAYLGDDKQMEMWHLTQKHLLSIKSLAEKNGAEVGFVVYPILVKLDKNYPFIETCKHLEEFAAINKFQTHNLLTSFLGYHSWNLWVSSYDQHPNEKAHRIVAESLLPFVKDLLIAHEKKDEENENLPDI